MPFAAALSEHPDPATATGEVIGEVLERLGSVPGDGGGVGGADVGVRPDLVVVFATAAHRDAFTDITAAVRRLLRPRVLLGATAVSVLGGSREVEGVPGLSLWAAAGIGEVTPLRLDPPTIGARAVGPLPLGAGPGGEVAGGDRVLLLLPDPFTFPADAFVAEVSARQPGLRVVGGLASASPVPGGNLLVLDEAVYAHGAVGALLPAGAVETSFVSQGCRPVGRPLTVTRSQGNLLQELAGRPALERLGEVADAVGPDDRALLAAGVHLGRVIDEHKADFHQGDFLIRAVLGADGASGALAVGDQVEVGSTVQFQVRDATSADEDLRLMLTAQEADAALVFTCNGRGLHFFGTRDHDASLVTELTGSVATAGMFCAGELGPVGAANFVHGYTASVALFRDRR